MKSCMKSWYIKLDRPPNRLSAKSPKSPAPQIDSSSARQPSHLPQHSFTGSGSAASRHASNRLGDWSDAGGMWAAAGRVGGREPAAGSAPEPCGRVGPAAGGAWRPRRPLRHSRRRVRACRVNWNGHAGPGVLDAAAVHTTSHDVEIIIHTEVQLSAIPGQIRQ